MDVNNFYIPHDPSIIYLTRHQINICQTLNLSNTLADDQIREKLATFPPVLVRLSAN